MRSRCRRRVIRAAGLTVLALRAAGPVAAETTACTPITTLPFTITVQGIYCLTTDLAIGGGGGGITIATNNVVLDLNGHKIGGLASGPATFATGIFASAKQNITIRNGTVRGFAFGILLGDSPPYATSQGHMVTNVRA